MGEVIYITSLISTAAKRKEEDKPSTESSAQKEKIEGFKLNKKILCALMDYNESEEKRNQQKDLDDWHDFIGAAYIDPAY